MTKFKLQRFAALKLEKNATKFEEGQTIYHEGVEVVLRHIPNVPEKHLLVATAYFDAEGITGAWDENVVKVRERAETAITAVADVLAIATCGGRLIESCTPHMSVSWPDGTSPNLGSEWEMKALRSVIEPVGNQYIDLAALAGGVEDRLSGVSLMALALSNSNGLGKYLGLCRLFEDAFALGIGQLSKRLAKMLADGPIDLSYSKSEVDEWVLHRDGAAHGDLAKAKEHVLELDVLKYIPRMQQAAFDVLLNKENWHSSDATRRNLCRPRVLFKTDPLHIFATVNRPIDYQYKLVDPFCEWPIAGDCKIDLAGNIVFPKLNAAFPTTMSVLPEWPNIKGT